MARHMLPIVSVLAVCIALSSQANFIESPMQTNNEFIILSQPESVSRIDLATKKIEPLVTDLKSVTGIEFDIKNNCLFYADSHANVIARKCLNGIQSTEILVDTNISSVEALAYDWMSEHLYFIDVTNNKIELIKTSIGTKLAKHHLRYELFHAGAQSKLRSIAVSPSRGYLFWTEKTARLGAIKRINLDGDKVTILMQQPLVNSPIGITIDHATDQLYWIDNFDNYIARSDFDGKTIEKIFQQDQHVSILYSIGVYKNRMYWDNWNDDKSIYAADKNTGEDIEILFENITKPMHLKMVTNSMQIGSNACGTVQLCSHFCVATPDNHYSCLCPTGLKKITDNNCFCPGIHEPHSNGTCPKFLGVCSAGLFECANQLCVPMENRCDGDNDCGDHSDESGCDKFKHQCPKHTFQCKSDGKCILQIFRCDQDVDCDDKSDEQGCQSINCADNEFRCSDSYCISSSFVCNGRKDCKNGLDETDCPTNESVSACNTNLFSCGDGQCIDRKYVCDAAPECDNAADEQNCDRINTTNTTEIRRLPSLLARPHNSTAINIVWDAPAELNRKNLKYAIYYGKTLDEYLKSTPIITNELQAILGNLQSCEKYFVDVGVLDVNDKSQPPPSPIETQTLFDPRAHPRQAAAIIDHRTQTVKITWRHSCLLPGQYPTYYVINITDVALKNVTFVKQRTVGNGLQMYERKLYFKGAKLELRLAASEARAIDVHWIIDAIALPSPKRLTIELQNNAEYKFDWDLVEFNESAFRYELIVVQGLILDNTIEPLFQISTKRPPVFQSFDRLTNVALPSSGIITFTASVRICTDYGYMSAFQRFEHISIDSQNIHMKLTNWSAITDWIIIVVLILFLILIALVAFFSIKHHRINKPPADETPMRSYNLSNDFQSSLSPSNPTKRENIANQTNNKRNVRQDSYSQPLIEEHEDDEENDILGEIVMNSDLAL